MPVVVGELTIRAEPRGVCRMNARGIVIRGIAPLSRRQLSWNEITRVVVAPDSVTLLASEHRVLRLNRTFGDEGYKRLVAATREYLEPDIDLTTPARCQVAAEWYRQLSLKHKILRWSILLALIAFWCGTFWCLGMLWVKTELPIWRWLTIGALFATIVAPMACLVAGSRDWRPEQRPRCDHRRAFPSR